MKITAGLANTKHSCIEYLKIDHVAHVQNMSTPLQKMCFLLD